MEDIMTCVYIWSMSIQDTMVFGRLVWIYE